MPPQNLLHPLGYHTVECRWLVVSNFDIFVPPSIPHVPEFSFSSFELWLFTIFLVETAMHLWVYFYVRISKNLRTCAAKYVRCGLHLFYVAARCTRSTCVLAREGLSLDFVAKKHERNGMKFCKKTIPYPFVAPASIFTPG